MIIIAGLGNPTKQYEGTRHNAGFRVIDKIADDYGISINKKEFKGLCGSGYIEGQKVLLLKPQTFMNISGVCVAGLVDYYSLDMEDVIIIYDDVTLDIGKIRLRPHGSAGGHNGIKSLINELGTQEFQRIRVGVGKKPVHYDLADWVLGHFKKEEREVMDKSVQLSAEAVESILDKGIGFAMNMYNGL